VASYGNVISTTYRCRWSAPTMRLPSRSTGGLRQQVPASARRSWRRNGCLVRAARGCLGPVVIGLNRGIELLASSRGRTALWTGAVGSGRYRTCASRGFLVGNGLGRECCSIARDGRSGRRVAQMRKSRWSRAVEGRERESLGDGLGLGEAWIRCLG
jgi:hypothetical protein